MLRTLQEVEQHQAREVLRCKFLFFMASLLSYTSATLTDVASAGLLHTIIFSRALGPVKPQEEDSEIFDITYVRVQTCPSINTDC